LVGPLGSVLDGRKVAAVRHPLQQYMRLVLPRGGDY
jgi:hypothetical protein